MGHRPTQLVEATSEAVRDCLRLGFPLPLDAEQVDAVHGGQEQGVPAVADGEGGRGWPRGRGVPMAELELDMIGGEYLGVSGVCRLAEEVLAVLEAGAGCSVLGGHASDVKAVVSSLAAAGRGALGGAETDGGGVGLASVSEAAAQLRRLLPAICAELSALAPEDEPAVTGVGSVAAAQAVLAAGSGGAAPVEGQRLLRERMAKIRDVSEVVADSAGSDGDDLREEVDVLLDAMDQLAAEVAGQDGGSKDGSVGNADDDEGADAATRAVAEIEALADNVEYCVRSLAGAGLLDGAAQGAVQVLSQLLRLSDVLAAVSEGGDGCEGRLSRQGARDDDQSDPHHIDVNGHGRLSPIMCMSTGGVAARATASVATTPGLVQFVRSAARPVLANLPLVPAKLMVSLLELLLSRLEAVCGLAEDSGLALACDDSQAGVDRGGIADGEGWTRTGGRWEMLRRTVEQRLAALEEGVRQRVQRLLKAEAQAASEVSSTLTRARAHTHTHTHTQHTHTHRWPTRSGPDFFLHQPRFRGPLRSRCLPTHSCSPRYKCRRDRSNAGQR